MSAFLVSAETCASIADYITRVSNGLYESNGFSIPDSLRAEIGPPFISAREIYYKLMDLNRCAYFSRYTSEDPAAHDVQEYTPRDISTRVFWKKGVFVVCPWHYVILKKLDCFIYQCCEDSTENDGFLIGLKDFSSALRDFIIQNNELYNNAAWG